jgi:hypothetical protein
MSVPTIAPAKGMRNFEFKQSRYKHLEGMNVLRSLVVGSSGSGKGILMQSLILDVFEGVFERVFLFSKTAKSDHTWEPVLRYIRKTLKVPEEEECFFEDFDPAVINGIIEQQKRIIDYEKAHNFKKLHQICIIVDDFAGDEGVMRGKRGEALKNLYLMGRHYGINLIVSVQKWRLASTVMRTQATSVFYFKARSMADLEGFLEENSALVPGGKKTLMEIYRAATADSPHSFLTVDLLTKDPNKIFMKRFESYLVATINGTV